MVIVGGLQDDWNYDDPLKNGIGLIDLQSLEFLDSYDASAAAYESPSIVSAWYDDGSVERACEIATKGC